MGKRRFWFGNTGARGSSLTARAGIGFEKFQTNFTLLGASLFYGIILARCLLLMLELPEVSYFISKESLLNSLAEGELNKIEWLPLVASLPPGASCYETVDVFDECTEGEDSDILLLVSMSGVCGPKVVLFRSRLPTSKDASSCRSICSLF